MKLYFFIFLIFLIIACSKNQDVYNGDQTPIVLSELIDARNKVTASIKYREYDSKNECYIRIDDKINYCVNIDSAIFSTENGIKYIYAVENGNELDENKEKMTAHVNLGSLKFFKFEMTNDNKLLLISESDLLNCGPYGNKCSAATYKFGNGPELAWLVSTGDMHQGYSGNSLSAYTSFGKKINPFINIQTSYSNESALAIDDSDATKLETKVTTIPSATEKFFDLNINVSSKEIKKKKSSQLDFTTIIKFDPKSNSYVLDAVKKIYEGKEY